MSVYPVASQHYLPARRTDGIKTTADLDELHRTLWDRADHRNGDQIEIGSPSAEMTPAMKAIMVAQGRIRISGKQRVPANVKDPEIWEQEAVDLRDLPVEEGRTICQFCGDDYETPPKPRKFVICNPCADLIGIAAPKNIWDENRNLAVTSLYNNDDEAPKLNPPKNPQVPFGQDEVISRFEDGDHPTWIAEDLGMSLNEVKNRIKRAGKKLPKGRAPAR